MVVDRQEIGNPVKLIRVFQYREYNSASGDWIVSRVKITEERIRIRGAEIVPGTGEDVDLFRLNENGAYVPRS